MKQFRAWLDIQANDLLSIIIIATLTLIVKISYTIALLLTLQAININMPEYEPIGFSLLNTGTWVIVALAVFSEEYIFRYFPLSIVTAVAKSNTHALLVTGVVSSVIFGWLHGGVLNILMQGMGGFFYCILYLKCGGLQDNHKKALATTSSVHFLFNTIFCIVEILHGNTTI